MLDFLNYFDGEAFPLLLCRSLMWRKLPVWLRVQKLATTSVSSSSRAVGVDDATFPPIPLVLVRFSARSLPFSRPFSQ